jgi:CTP-dependent riboflavin kinase
MKRLLLIGSLLLVGAYSAAAQTACPQGFVCLPQATANETYDKLNQLVAAKDLIIKMLSERNASDATIAAANKVIEAMKEVDVINGQIVAKQKDLIALYEKVINLQQTIIEKLTTQLNKPKSIWDKVLTAVKEIAYLAAGIALGRAIP